jgi:NosR/NirI family transcriptional regulator, nitrous oxide reductase regulator
MELRQTKQRILGGMTKGKRRKTKVAGRRFVIMLSSFVFCLSSFVWMCGSAWAAEERFPPPEFRSGYKFPQPQVVLPRGAWWDFVDAGLLAAFLAIAAYLAVKRRSRRGIFWLTVVALAYFGFYRQGCVCAVGSVQNVAAAAFAGSALPSIVGVFFALPLIMALFFGRVFCAGVCPLGAIQDVVLLRPVQVPAWLEAGLGLAAHAYLAAAVVFAAVGSEFLICSYDPFVGLFRFGGTFGMLMLGAGLLLASMFIGRTYCRFLCPYGVLLRTLAAFAKWPVHVSPAACISCKLCERSCPFGALNRPRTALDAQARLRRMTAAVVLGTVAIVLGSLGGYAGRSLWSRLDRNVQLAQAIQAAEAGTPPADMSDLLAAWQKTGESPADVYARANAITHRLGWGGAIAGAWLGAVVAFRLWKWGHGLPRTIYDADTGACLGCARCFESCPVELERRGIKVSLPVLAEARA